MEETAVQIGHASVFANVLPLLVALWRRKELGRSQHALLWLLGLGLAVQLASFQLGRQYINNYFLFHIYIPLEMGLFLLIFHRERLGFARKGWMLGIGIGMALFCVWNAAWGEGYASMPATAFMIEGGLMALAGILYFLQVFREMEVWKLESQFMFWVSLGIWVYFLGGMLIIMFDDFLQNAHEDAYFLVWGIHSCLILLTGILYAIALTCKTQVQKS